MKTTTSLEAKLDAAISEAISHALRHQQMAVAPVSNIKVGACVIAEDDLGFGLYGAHNVEASKSMNIHAEELAIWTALANKQKPKVVIVTSQSVEEQVALCFRCRHLISKVNPDARVIVLNPDGSTKLDLNFRLDLGRYGYFKEPS